MRGIYLGIDVGGTHTDGVAVEGRHLHNKVKVPTRPDLIECTLDALDELLDGLNPRAVCRVVLSTTLVTNAVIQNRLEPTGTVITAGPGLHPGLLCLDERCKVIGGAIDHRGREVAPLDETAVAAHLDALEAGGVKTLAVAGKFSSRNPSHEQRVAQLAGDRFDYVALGHVVAGTLNFPRRVATAYLAAGAWRIHREFVRSMTEALRRHNILAPLYVLRADGGTQRAAGLVNPAETALSGPAASAMGVDALGGVDGNTLTLDVGGTTTDLSLFCGEGPALERRGATVGPYSTQIRALFSRSAGAGGDSRVRVDHGTLTVGPDRAGPPAAFGGDAPTPSDALVLLGRTLGDRSRAAAAIAPLAAELGEETEATGRRILRALGRAIADEARSFVDQVNRRPVYTIHELLEGQALHPVRAVVVGGPARALAPYLEEALDLPVYVPDHFDVANAVGAALARINAEVHLIADTSRGYLSIPQADVYEPLHEPYTLAEARARATGELLALARGHSLSTDQAPLVDITEEETFHVIEGYRRTGSIHRLRAQLRPGILGRVE